MLVTTCTDATIGYKIPLRHLSAFGHLQRRPEEEGPHEDSLLREDADDHDGVDDEHDGPVHHGPELEEVDEVCVVGVRRQQRDDVLVQAQVKVDEDAAGELEGGESTGRFSRPHPVHIVTYLPYVFNERDDEAPPARPHPQAEVDALEPDPLHVLLDVLQVRNADELYHDSQKLFFLLEIFN